MADDGQRELVLRYVHDDTRRRREFDRRLAVFLRAQPGGDRWNITPLVDTLDRLGEQIPGVLVRLSRRPGAPELRVLLEFDLPPIPAGKRGGAP
jgi:hypothetical protein